jgi:hypothetical protein
MLDPERAVLGFKWIGGEAVVSLTDNYVRLPVVALEVYYLQTPSFVATFTNAAFYDANGLLLSESVPVLGATAPAGAVTGFFSFVIADTIENLAIVSGAGAFELYYDSVPANPMYRKLNRTVKAEPGQQFYRESIDGSLVFLKSDYDYIVGLPFDTTIKVLGFDSESGQSISAYFHLTDCEIDSDDKKLTAKLSTTDLYEDFLGSKDKVFNLLDIAAELEPVLLTRRPILQVYVAGDNVLTNIVSGAYWEQQLSIDPVYDDSVLTGTHKMFNALNIRAIPASYVPLLSTDVTGSYNSSRVNTTKPYKLVETAIPFVGFFKRKFHIVPVAATEGAGWSLSALYETEYTDYFNISVNALLFKGVNGQTGEFYFAEYRIYARLYTSLLEVAAVATHPIPANDLVPANQNYTRIVPYGINQFVVYDEFQGTPNKFGRVPEGSPDSGLYYRQLLPAVESGASNAIPISQSNWKAVSLWYYDTSATKYFLRVEGEKVLLRDCFPLHSVIQALLNANKLNLTFTASSECSQFLYAAINPLGGFTFLDFDFAGILDAYAGNLKWLLTPKSNAIYGNYEQPAAIAEITLEGVLKMLKTCFNCYWHLENGMLRIEHISWYDKGGTYSGVEVGADLTSLIQPRNGKPWSFAQNKWSYEKQNMPERIEFSWMDKVSSGFEAAPVNMIGKFVQPGNIEERSATGFTTDVDFMAANQSEVSKQGFCMFGAVIHEGINKAPFVEVAIPGYELSLQNGFLSFPYLRDRFLLFNLPTDNVEIDGQEQTIIGNVSRFKKQDVAYPHVSSNYYALVRTELGLGKLQSTSLDFESMMEKSTIMHETI